MEKQKEHFERTETERHDGETEPVQEPAVTEPEARTEEPVQNTPEPESAPEKEEEGSVEACAAAEAAAEGTVPAESGRQRCTWKRVFGCLGICLIALTAVFAGIIGYVHVHMQNIRWEAGEAPAWEKVLPGKLAAALCTVEQYAIDTALPGEHPVTVRAFGGIPVHGTIHVADTTPPSFSLIPIHTIAGTGIGPEDFILSCSDPEAVFSADGEFPDTDTPGTFAVTITAADAYGNMAMQETLLTVMDASHSLQMELGTADAAEFFDRWLPAHTSMNVEAVDIHTVGNYLLEACTETEKYIWQVQVSDTTAPDIVLTPLCVRTDTAMLPEQFVESGSDASGYTVSFAETPDFQKQGLQSVKLAAEDAHGNRTEAQTQVLICTIPEQVDVELGATQDEVEAMLFADARSVARQFTVQHTKSVYDTGIHPLELKTEYGTLTVNVHIADTTPPVIRLKDLTCFCGDTVRIEDFIVSCSDTSEVSWRYITKPSTGKEGVQKISIRAEDVYGNHTIAETSLTVVKDSTPPVIYGVQDVSVLVGKSVSPAKGVYAVDNRDGSVAVQVNADAVNTAKAGKYPVYYTCTDAAGNPAECTSYVTVTAVNMDTVNGLADRILAVIITDSMTPREKAWAIYTWCTENMRYSTRTSHLMGHYVDGAYSGLTTFSGNCYIYYAVSSAMLSRVGIENLEIRRDDPDDPHYWSLVKMDDSWYHFDTCPHVPGHEMECFLLTDAEVQHYSETEVENYYSFDASLYPTTP